MNVMRTIQTATSTITAPARLSGRWLLAARALWCVLAIYPMALFALGIAPAIALYRVPCDPSVCTSIDWRVLSLEQARALAAHGISLNLYAFYAIGLLTFQALVFAGCGWLIFLRRSDEPIALIASLAILCLGVQLISGIPALARFIIPGVEPLVLFTYVWGNWLFPALLYLLPDGRFVPHWGRWCLIVWGGYTTYAVLVAPSSPNDVIPRIAGLILLLCTAVGVYGQIYRYVRVATQPQRQQIKWLALGTMGIFASALIGATFTNVPTAGGSTPIEARLLAGLLVTLGFCSFPITLMFAILRHRLWEIDLVLNRTFVYGGLTATIVALYTLIVGGLSALFQMQGSATIAYVGVGLVALLAQSLRDRLQRGVNRLMFGQRDEPYTVLARFGRQLETTPALATLLPTITATIKETLRLPVVQIEAASPYASLAHEPIAGASAADGSRLQAFPLLYRNELLGRLIVAPREGESALSASDRRLLEDLARQAGVAVHAARVTMELQQARERLVTAREEERRRLRRDLHDGLGPTLAALTAQAEAARDLVPLRPDQSVAILSDMAVQAQAATADIRRLVYDLRPPALDDLGLAGAIQAQAQKVEQTNNLTVHVTASPLPPLPAAVEVAAYRIVQEALVNVVRHAGAQQCRVMIAIEGQYVRVEISDDGRGLPAVLEVGVGLMSMRERAEELGGTWQLAANYPGVRVIAQLPITVPIQAQA